MGIAFIFKEKIEMIVSVKLKWRVASTHNLDIIVSNLNDKLKPNLVILIRIDKCMKISHHHAILSYIPIACPLIKYNEQLSYNEEKVT